MQTEAEIVNYILQNGLILDRGYTGHEHLFAVGIIHMNGRLYDPALKRFLSPDNYIQDPYNTQNFNRYGYVLNNPLLYTDPSGELMCANGACKPGLIQNLFNYISGSNIMTSGGLPGQVSGLMKGVNAAAAIGAAASLYSFVRNIGQFFPNKANLNAHNNNVTIYNGSNFNFSSQQANPVEISSGVSSSLQNVGNNSGLFSSGSTVNGLNNCDICNQNMPNAKPGDIYTFADGRQAQFAGNDLVKGGWTDYASGKPLDAAGNPYNENVLTFRKPSYSPSNTIIDGVSKLIDPIDGILQLSAYSSTGKTISQLENIKKSGRFLHSNGKYYNLNYFGNQYQNSKLINASKLNFIKEIHLIKYAGRGLGALGVGATVYQFASSDRSGQDYARLGGAGIIMATSVIPVAGPFISIGLGIADSAGAFDTIYNSFE